MKKMSLESFGDRPGRETELEFERPALKFELVCVEMNKQLNKQTKKQTNKQTSI